MTMYIEQISPPRTVTATRADIRNVIRKGFDHAYSYAANGSRLQGQIECLRRLARLSIQWAAAESAGLVRLCVSPDDDTPIEDLASDMFEPTSVLPMSGGMRQLNKEYKEFERNVRDYGVVGILGQFRTGTDGEWWTADSCLGFIGNDVQDNDYCWDIMGQTLSALRAALQSRCPECGRSR